MIWLIATIVSWVVQSIVIGIFVAWIKFLYDVIKRHFVWKAGDTPVIPDSELAAALSAKIAPKLQASLIAQEDQILAPIPWLARQGVWAAFPLLVGEVPPFVTIACNWGIDALSQMPSDQVEKLLADRRAALEVEKQKQEVLKKVASKARLGLTGTYVPTPDEIASALLSKSH